ncbi:hypothetical protein [Luteolibacter sp. LG18]|uniref:hypothetical protein n=1 Tax=Luteolibacter sp. LG18 TaxID=2819286 RepID=UPI002B2B8284|nr:hypothetical protein llg_07450 [Luteolibacter sp. LG18]
MKHHLIILAGISALALSTQAVRAEGEGDKPAERGPAKERILGKFDTNKDGALSKEELAAAPERLSKRLLESWDTDKNGELSKAEVDAIKAPEGGKGGERPNRPKRDGGEPKKEG